MDDYQLAVLEQAPLPLLAMLVISFVYYKNNQSPSTLYKHLSYSHCALPILGYFYAVIASGSTTINNHEPHSIIFIIIMFASFLLSIVSIFTFKGSKYFHILLLATVSITAYLLLAGGMAITHDWL